MARKNQLTHKVLYNWLVTAALLISSAEAGIAQDMQQMPGSSSGGFSSTAAGHNRSNAPDAAMRSSALTLVPQDFARMTLAPGFLMALNVLDDPDAEVSASTS